MSNMIRIGNVIISEDQFGRYRLNDLHKIAGGETRHKPSNWLQLNSTKELLEEIRQENRTAEISAVETIDPLITIEGANGGTFAIKKLVYAYATWISPKFFSHVLDVFEDSERKAREMRENLSEIEILEENVRITQKLIEVKKKIAEGALFEKKRMREAEVIAMKDIKETYFPGVGEERIYDFLRFENHPKWKKGNNEVFIEEGLMELAEKFWRECEKAYGSKVLLMEHKAFTDKVARVPLHIVEEYWSNFD